MKFLWTCQKALIYQTILYFLDAHDFSLLFMTYVKSYLN